jgi:hypothetical protein
MLYLQSHISNYRSIPGGPAQGNKLHADTQSRRRRLNQATWTEIEVCRVPALLAPSAACMLVGALAAVTVDDAPTDSRFCTSTTTTWCRCRVHHGMQLAGACKYSQHRRARAVGDDDPADQALELPRRVLLRACACLLAGAVPSCRS